jgi:hypothetical protein
MAGLPKVSSLVCPVFFVVKYDFREILGINKKEGGSHMSKKTLLTVLIVVVVLAASLPVQAAEIYGCAHKINGQLRIVNSPDQCRPSEENVILWNGINQNPLPYFDGYVCWDMAWQDRPSGSIMKLRVTYTGNNYYTLQSDVGITQGGHMEGAFGYAKLTGTQIIMSLSAVHSNSQPLPTENADFYGYQIFLDPLTLNGSGWSTIAGYHVSTETSKVLYQTGTLTYRTTCP